MNVYSVGCAVQIRGITVNVDVVTVTGCECCCETCDKLLH